MGKDAWNDRRVGLEEEFFAKENQKLAEKLKQQALHEKNYQELASSLGITDQAVVDSLMKEGLSAASLIALAMVPLVQVAWADQNLDPGEKQAIMQAASARGITAGTPTHELLLQWLAKAPSPSLFASWQKYVEALRERMDKAAFTKLGAELNAQAQAIAKAAGGFLGLGNKVSDAEARELKRIAQLFQA